MAANALLAVALLLPGYTVLCLVAPGRRLRPATVAALSFGIGAGTMALVLFWLSLAGFRPAAASLIGLSVAAAGTLAVLWQRGALVRLPSERSSRPSWDEWLLLAALAVPVLWIATDALRLPLYNVDAVGIWGLKAKVLAHQSIRDTPYFADPTLSYSHRDYPLLIPFVNAAARALRGIHDETLGKLVGLGVFAAFALLLYDGLRARRLSRPATLVLLLLYLLSPRLLNQFAAGIADPALMLYYAGSVLFLVSWLKSQDVSDLRIGSLMTVFLLFTKNEGLALAGINLVVFSLAVFASRPRLLALWGHALLVALLTLPWLAFRAGVPKTHENYSAHLRPSILLDHLDRVPEILWTLGATMADPLSWAGLWLLLPLAWLLTVRSPRSRETTVLWACLICHLAVYVVVLIVTPWNLTNLLYAKAYPLLLQASPVLVLLLATHWGRLLSTRAARSTSAVPA